MTDRDKIALPRPEAYGLHNCSERAEGYAIAAVLADRERRADPAQPAKPKVHSVALSLGPDNSWSCYAWAVHPTLATVTLCWTDDGRAWIESERNRELAAELRRSGLSTPSAADALDGGVR